MARANTNVSCSKEMNLSLRHFCINFTSSNKKVELQLSNGIHAFAKLTINQLKEMKISTSS